MDAAMCKTWNKPQSIGRHNQLLPFDREKHKIELARQQETRVLLDTKDGGFLSGCL